ncbi:MAG TPA: pilus assembly protein [Chloroflexi bacterium]|nr:pilus assembly protein [Chloroflexota bacterium]
MNMTGKRRRSEKKNSGQSFVELAIVLPLLLFLLVAFVEVGAIIYNYLSLLDVVREAARFAADRDPEVLNGDMSNYPVSACEDDALHYYLDTACVVIGTNFNQDITLNPATDDIAISIFTIDNNVVVDRKPNDGDGVWSLYSDNWTKNCDGSFHSNTPFFPQGVGAAWVSYTPPTVGAGTPTPDIPASGLTDKGIVLVEIYYCHHQLLNLPLISDIIPNPVPLHAFAVMPAPQAAPTPTPLP